VNKAPGPAEGSNIAGSAKANTKRSSPDGTTRRRHKPTGMRGGTS
jgi:hypothetical protein